jgi:hypothetical protein
MSSKKGITPSRRAEVPWNVENPLRRREYHNAGHCHKNTFWKIWYEWGTLACTSSLTALMKVSPDNSESQIFYIYQGIWHMSTGLHNLITEADASVTAEMIKDINFECLCHPPYSPDFPVPHPWILVEWLSDLMMCKRQCMSSCMCSQGTVFTSGESGH